MKFATLAEALEFRYANQPKKILYNFMALASASVGMSNAELYAHATAIAASLQDEVTLGDRVLILLPPGFDFICAMYACLMSGVIAVPAFPPITQEMSKRVVNFIKDADIKAVIVDDEIAKKMRISKIFNPIIETMNLLKLMTPKMKSRYHAIKAASHAAKLKVINLNKIKSTSADFKPVIIKPDTIAYLQYTSGSTSQPRGVVLKHQQLLVNMVQISKLFRTREDSVVISWLPPFHDMGLLNNVLMPVFEGFKTFQMSPFTFIQKPQQFLKAVGENKGTVIGGPDFGFRYCIERISEKHLETLDLSTLEIVFSGAEKIHYDTLKKFFNKFAPCGLKKNIFLPCYGMAEATLLVSGKIANLEDIHKTFNKKLLLEKKLAEKIHHQDPEAYGIVSVGKAAEGISIVVIDPETQKIVEEGTIGEICIHGDNVMENYWQKEAANKEYFLNLQGKKFFRTGDLGFFHEEELYIVGRLKEMIIVAGKNHYPQDIELSVEQSDRHLKTGAVGTFAIEKNNMEQLVIVSEIRKQESKSDYEKIIQNINQAVSANHMLTPHEILLLKRGTIPKTTSGKIKRVLCKKLYEQDAFHPIYRKKIA